MNQPTAQQKLHFRTRRTERIDIFDADDYLEQYRKLSPEEIVMNFERFLRNTIQCSENASGGNFGTVELADGREARVEVRIDAAYVLCDKDSDNLELF